MDSSILDRIRKVKGLIESTNENEAAVAAQMLTRLLHENDLRIEEIGEVPESNPITSDELTVLGNTMTFWHNTLARSICRVTFCNILYSHRWEGHKLVRTGIFVGRRKDAEVARYLFETLSAKIKQLAFTRTSEYILEFRKQFGEDPTKRGGKDHPTVFRLSWIRGAIDTVACYLYKEFSRLESTPKGNALIVLRGTEVKEWIATNFPNIIYSKSSAGRGNFNDAAYRLGQQDGKNIRANRAINSSGTHSHQIGAGSQ